jgi:hypothetical protein
MLADNDQAGRLNTLADEIGERQWTMADISSAKHALRAASQEYAAALDAFDSGVFRRRFPHLF